MKNKYFKIKTNVDFDRAEFLKYMNKRMTKPIILLEHDMYCPGFSLLAQITWSQGIFNIGNDRIEDIIEESRNAFIVTDLFIPENIYIEILDKENGIDSNYKAAIIQEFRGHDKESMDFSSYRYGILHHIGDSIKLSSKDQGEISISSMVTFTAN